MEGNSNPTKGPATRKRTLQELFHQVRAGRARRSPKPDEAVGAAEEDAQQESGRGQKLLRSTHFGVGKERPAKPPVHDKAIEDSGTRVEARDGGRSDAAEQPPDEQAPKMKPTAPAVVVVSDGEEADEKRSPGAIPHNPVVAKEQGQVESAGTTRRRTLLSRAQQRIKVVQGDITTYYADAEPEEQTAVVNAANRTLLGGGGVDHAIHSAAGPQLLRACRKIPEVAPGVRCETGGVRVTDAFELPATFIMHTVGPVWRGGGKGEAKQLGDCYKHCLAEAARRHVTSIAFPAISTGIYGYPLEEACRVAVNACLAHIAANPAPKEIVLCCFDERTAATYRDLLLR